MKKQLRKALAILCALAFAVSGITFTPSNVDAADTWVRTNFSASGAFTRPDGTIWKFKSMNNGSNTWGNSRYCITDSSAPKTDYTKLKFRKDYVGSDGVPHAFSWSWDFATIVTVDELATTPYNLFGLETGKSYSGSITINSTKATETSTSGQKCKLRMKFFGNNTYDVDLKQGDNVIEIPEAAYSGNGDIEFNIIQLPQYGEITVKNITLEEDTDAFIAVPSDQDYVPKEEGVSSPWTLRANMAGGSWGQMSYKIDGDIDKVESTIIRVDNPAQDDATKLEGTEVIDGKTVNHKEEIFKKKKKAELEAKHSTDPSYNVENDPEYKNYVPSEDPNWATYDSQVDPEAWWWWNSAKLTDYLKKYPLTKGYKYKGTLTVDYTRPSSPDCNTPQLRLVVNGEVIVKNLSAGLNTIAIGGSDGFMYKGENKSLDFNLDMVDKGAIIQVTNLSFTKADDFVPVPANVEDGYNPTGTPWYISVQNNEDYHPGLPEPTLWGQMSYSVTSGQEANVSGTKMRVDVPAHDTDIDKATALKNKRKKEAEAEGKPFDEDSYVAQDDPDWATYDPQQDPGAWWWWNSAKLTDYLKKYPLTKGNKYIGTLKFKYTKPSKSGKSGDDFTDPQLRMVINGEPVIVDLDQGSSTYSYTIGGTSGFMYTEEFTSIEFNYDLLDEGGIIQVTELSFAKADDFNHVPSLKENNNQPFVPADTPWAISVQNDQSEGQDSWGMMSYKISGNPTAIGSTYMRVDTPAHDTNEELLKDKEQIFKKKKRNALLEEHKDDPTYNVDTDPAYTNYDPTTDENWATYDPTDDPDAWWWWNSAKLTGFLGENYKNLTPNKRYTAQVKYNYTSPAEGDDTITTPQLRVICGEKVSVVDLEAGQGKSADIAKFTYTTAKQDVEFNLDMLETGGIIQITDIVFIPDNFTPVTPNVEGGEPVPNTPWVLSVQNNPPSTWGQMSYSVEGTPSLYSSTKIRVEVPAHDDNDPDTGIKKADALKNKKAKELRDKLANELLAEKYDALMEQHKDDPTYEIDKDPEYTNYDPTKDPTYLAYDPTQDSEYINYVPQDDPMWDTYDPQTDPDAWWWWNSGKIKDFFNTAVDNQGNPIADGKTYVGEMTITYTPSEDEEEYPAKLRVILNGEILVYDLQEGTHTYPISTFDYSDTYPDVEYNFDLLGKDSIIQVNSLSFTLTDGDWTKVPDNVGDGSTIPVDYSKDIPTTGGPEGAVDVVPNQQGNITHDWNIFAGIWGGHGAKLYYKNDIPDHTDQLQVRIGDGERWDPACAQIKVTNEDAYAQLEQYAQYYMTYSFYSTEAGTVHINFENYEPDKLERVEVKKGWNTVKKYLPYVDRLNYDKTNLNKKVNITMFLTPTTYEYDPDTKKTNVVMDGSYLPKGTILSNFRVEYTRVDEDNWTLVRDNRFTPIETDPEDVKERYKDCQDYDDLVMKDSKPIFSAYTNSFFNGRMSYLEGYNQDGEDNIAKMGLRLDDTAFAEDPYYEFGDEDWGCNVRIPNSYFYDRTDTNGNPLAQGKHYKLRFYYNTSKKSASRYQGLIMVRQGYDQNKPTSYYAGQTGLNMANGTISTKSGYNSHSDQVYDKSGGIDFVYNESATTENQYVQVDFSMFPADTYITDISWEFYAPQYNVYLNRSTTPDNDSPIIEGKQYKFPEAKDGYPGLKYFQDDNDPNKRYTPGQVVDFADFDADIHATAVQQHTVEIWSPGPNSTLLKTTTVTRGDDYTFPLATDPEFSNYKGYVEGDDFYAPGDNIDPVEKDYKVIAVPKGTYVVTIIDSSTDEVIGSESVPEGTNYELPNIDGYIDYTLEDGTTHKDPGDEIGPINKNTVVYANPAANTHLVKVIDAEDPDKTLDSVQVPDGDMYTLPTTEGYKDYTLPDQTTKDPGTEVGPITEPTTILANPIYSPVKVNHRDTGALLDDDSIRYDGYYELPTIDGIKDYTLPDGTTKNPGEKVGPIKTATNIIANPKTYTVTIVNQADHSQTLFTSEPVTHGHDYELPSLSSYDIIKYVYDGHDYQPGDEIGPIIKNTVVYAVLQNTYKIYIDYDPITNPDPVAVVNDGGNYTFPSGANAAKIGYISVNGGPVYALGSSVGPIHEDRYYLSVDDFTLERQMGASMLLNQAKENPRGIGFGCDFTIYKKDGSVLAFKDYPQVYKSEAFKLGTMITTEDLYYNYFDETLDLAQVAKAQAEDHPEYIRNIMNDYTFCDDENPTTNFASYRAGIVNLNDYNITRNFIARSYGYVDTTSGPTDVVYANYSEIRSIKTVATNLMKDPNWRTVYPDAWKQEIIEYCAAFED